MSYRYVCVGMSYYFIALLPNCFEAFPTYKLTTIGLFSLPNLIICYSSVQDELVPMVKAQNLTLSYTSESSIESELRRESTADISTIAVRYPGLDL